MGKRLLEVGVNSNLFILLDVEELHFYYSLLTRLKADDLIDEDLRRRAMDVLLEQWLLAREVTKSQSPVSQGEET